ncbi:hypothetical protein [Thalassoroseus pseudoceratinae]|uniref:hypothetical protein n=1 Tax=Thalassoroseus pseudoceratinae TaxID=2713176 RepID=UPI0014239336|nr:hypothetical protein [Thalassoroseus pseudoceratinae]
MILLFPNLDVLSLALTSGVIPPEVSTQPAETATADDGRVWVRPLDDDANFDANALKELGILERKSFRGSGGSPESVSCWPEVIPAEATATAPQLADRTPVLFLLPDPTQLADIATEMLRLGNDRQGFRRVKAAGGEVALLHVVGPPYYSLLRALEDESESDSRPRAFVETGSRVWVEFGYRHPLASQVMAPNGQVVLIAADGSWTTLDEGRFRDIYELLDLHLPTDPQSLSAADLDDRLNVSLQLVNGHADDAAELWVLTEKGAEQLDDLVRNSDDRLISRLAFAVGDLESADRSRTVVVRARPGSSGPPVLVLDGVACRPYLKLPNLFVPVGRRIHPPLRRDAVKNLLANDSAEITWLMPTDDSSFQPQSLSDSAFRPLADWVDYVLDNDRKALEEWTQSMQFDFEKFVCGDGRSERDAAPTRSEPEQQSQGSASTETKERRPSQKSESVKKAVAVPAPTASPKSSRRTRRVVKPSELEVRLQELRQAFHDSDAEFDSPERRELWQELAATYAGLSQNTDAALCWANAVWDEPSVSAEVADAWFDLETKSSGEPAVGGDDFEALVAKNRLSPSEVNLLAAHLIAAASSGSGIDNAENLPRVQTVLERSESLLPIRVAWLAWLSFSQLADNDVLALARARDRILERLYAQGLTPELDLPAFLRSTSNRTGDRYRTIGQRLVELQPKIRHWVEEESETRPTLKNAKTAAYANLITAYGLARMNRSDEARELLHTVREDLLNTGDQPDVVHQWVADAFGQRIEQALDGQAAGNRLSEELLTFFEPTDGLSVAEKKSRREAGYYLNKLRRQSRILHPHEQVNAWARFYQGNQTSSESGLASQLEQLIDLNDRDALATKLLDLLDEHGNTAPIDFDPLGGKVLLTSALEFAPRLGESHARELLDRVLPTLDELVDANQQAVLLEQSIEVAAHFGLSGPVQTFWNRLHVLFEKASRSETAETFGALIKRAVHGLRKLGMRSEVAEMLDQIERLVKANQFDQTEETTKSRSRSKTAKTGSVANADAADAERELINTKRRHFLMLNVAAGRFYLGQHDDAKATVNEVCEFLFQQKTLKPLERLGLLRVYLATLEQAPVEFALPRFEEVFDKLDQIAQPKAGGNMIRGAMDACERYYSPALLDVVETVVLAMISDDFTLDRKGRQLLEEHEYFIRRRIHHDVEHARNVAGI